MNYLFKILIVGLAGVIVPVAADAALGTNELDAARRQGTNSLDTFKRLITSSNYLLMGFTSTNEVPTATAGEPLLIYTIPLNLLTNFVPGNSFASLLDPDPQAEPAPVTRVILPVLVGTEVSSSLALRLVVATPGQVRWTNANWGRPKLIRNLMGTYGSIPNSQIKRRTTPFVVEIPVFDIWFIGYYNRANRLLLRSTADMKVGPITINRNDVVTDAAMQQLSIMAFRYNGLPN